MFVENILCARICSISHDCLFARTSAEKRCHPFFSFFFFPYPPLRPWGFSCFVLRSWSFFSLVSFFHAILSAVFLACCSTLHARAHPLFHWLQKVTSPVVISHEIVIVCATLWWMTARKIEKHLSCQSHFLTPLLGAIIAAVTTFLAAAPFSLFRQQNAIFASV